MTASSNSKQTSRFHRRHGGNVVLLEERTVALRYKGFADALVFSERPLRSGEIFAVDLELKESGWNGHMRMGLTTFAPSEESRLPTYSLPDLANDHPSWIFAVSKRFMFEPLLTDWSPDSPQIQLPEKALKPKRFCANITDLGSRMGIMYLAVGSSARMFFIGNGDEVKMCAESIPLRDPLYAVVDVYGKTRKIRLVQINNVTSLLEASREAITSFLSDDPKKLKSFVDSILLPKHLKEYLLSST